MASPNRLGYRFRFCEFELDAASGELRKAGVPIKLRLQAAKVLLLLAEHAGQIVSREEIRARLWSDDTFVDFERSINFCINQIRAALADNAEEPRYVETIPRRGYRFIAPLAIELPSEPVFSAAPAHRTTDPRSGGENSLGSAASSGLLAIPGSLPKPLAASWIRKHFKVIGIAIILAGMGIGFAIYQSFQRSKMPDIQHIRMTKLTNSGKAESVAISPDGRYVVYTSRASQGLGLTVHQVGTDSDVQILPPEAADFRGLTFSPDGNYIYFVRSDKNDHPYRSLYAMPVLGGSPRKLMGEIDSPVSFSPNGHQFAFARGTNMNSSEVRIANADGTGDRLVARIPETWGGFEFGTDWSHDGKTIAVTVQLNGKRAGYALDVVSVANGSVRELYVNDQYIGRPRWLPGGNALLVNMWDWTEQGQLWTISYPKGKARRLTNDLADYGSIDIAGNVDAAALIQQTAVANIWVAAGKDPARARQITFGGLPMFEIAPGPGGKLLAHTWVGGILWSMRTDGSERESLGQLGTVGRCYVTCGRFIVFASYEKGAEYIKRAQADGTDVKELVAPGPWWSPTCAQDGNFVFYVALDEEQKILGVPIQGGNSSKLAGILGEGITSNLTVSPNGKLLAYAFHVRKQEPIRKLAVVSSLDGHPVQLINLPKGISLYWVLLRWSHDGKSLYYLGTQNGATSLWEQPLAGGVPKQLMKFQGPEVIFDFNWTADGKQLLLSRGEITSDVVLLTNLR